MLILFVFISSFEKNPSGFNAIQLLSPPIKYDALVKVAGTLNLENFFPFNTIVSLVIISHADFGELIYDNSCCIFIAPNHLTVVDISCKIIHERENYSEGKIKKHVYKQLIFIKADDLIIEPNGIISSRWKKFFEYNMAKQITINAGIVCIYLKRANEEIVRYLQNLFLSDYIEIL